MSHFYGKLIGKGQKPQTITGTPNTGLVAEAMGMKGKIYVHVYDAGGVDYFEIFLENNSYSSSTGKSTCIARGVLDSDHQVEGFVTTANPATVPA
jgi:hypothetical protein